MAPILALYRKGCNAFQGMTVTIKHLPQDHDRTRVCSIIVDLERAWLFSVSNARKMLPPPKGKPSFSTIEQGKKFQKR